MSTRVRLLAVLFVGGVAAMGCTGGRSESDGAGAALEGGDSGGGESVDAGDAGAGRDAGPPLLTPAAAPECFALADSLAADLDAHAACSVDADCSFALLQGLQCFVRPRLADGTAPCPGYFAVADGHGIDVAGRIAGLTGCAQEALGVDTIFGLGLSAGGECRVGCAAEPVPRCREGICVLVGPGG